MTQLISDGAALRAACDKLLMCGSTTCLDCCTDVTGENHKYNAIVPCGPVTVTLDGFRPRKFWNGSSCTTLTCGNCDVFNDAFEIDQDSVNCWAWDSTFLNVGDNADGACSLYRYLSIRIQLSLRCCGYTDGTDRHHVLYWLGQVTSGYTDTPAASIGGLSQSTYYYVKLLSDVVDDNGCDFVDLSSPTDELECQIPPNAPATEAVERCLNGGNLWTYPTANGRCSPFDYDQANCDTGVDPGTMVLSV